MYHVIIILPQVNVVQLTFHTIEAARQASEYMQAQQHKAYIIPDMIETVKK